MALEGRIRVVASLEVHGPDGISGSIKKDTCAFVSAQQVTLGSVHFTVYKCNLKKNTTSRHSG
jgi:hypothetical protein